MPKTAAEVFRDFVRFTGDGLPGEPANAPLPIGDPSSGVHNPGKRDFREAIQGAFDAADAAAGYAASTTGAPLFTTRAAAQGATIPAWANQIMADGQVYQRDADGVALTTAGGVKWSPVGARATARAYGCVGDGIANDHARLTVSINDTRSRGIVLDGEGLTYRIAAQLTAIAGAVENLTLDASALTADLAWDMVAIGFEPVKPLTANALQGTRQINVTAHGYAVGDVLMAYSAMALENATNSVCTHWAEVTAVTANTISLSHALMCNLLVANNAQVQRLPKSAGTRLRNIKVIGSASCPGGIQMTRLYRPHVESCEAVNTEIRGLSLVSCFAPRTGIVRGERCNREGLGYAINVSGCGWAEIGDTWGRQCRHVLAWGAAGITPCVGGTFGSVIGAECLGSVFDTHPGAIGIWQRGGMVIGDMSPLYAAQDAITMQAAGGSIIARITGRPSRHICLIQAFHNAAAFQVMPDIEADVSGDTFDGPGQGVSLNIEWTAGLRSARLRIRGTHSAESAYVKIANGSAIDRLDIDGAAISGARAIFVNQQDSGRVGSLSLRGRFRTTNPDVVAAHVYGPTDTGIGRANIVVSGLDAAGGAYGLRVDNRADAKGAVAAFLSGSAAPSIASGGATIN